jgi:hypothetical protein
MEVLPDSAGSITRGIFITGSSLHDVKDSAAFIDARDVHTWVRGPRAHTAGMDIGNLLDYLTFGSSWLPIHSKILDTRICI